MADTFEDFMARAQQRQDSPEPQPQPQQGGDDSLEAFMARQAQRSVQAAPQQEQAGPPEWKVVTSPEGTQRRFRGFETETEYTVENPWLGLPAHTKINAKGQAAFLNEKLGPGSAWIDEAENVFVLTPDEKKKPPEEQRPMILNRPGISKADLAYAPEALLGIAAAPAIPAIAGALGAGTAGTAAVAAGVGAATTGVRQLAGAALPGEEDAGIGERAFELGVAGAFEAFGAPGVAKALMKKAKGAIPKTAQKVADRVVRGVALSDATPEVIQEGLELRQRTGIDFTIGDLTKSPRIQKVERFLNQSWFTKPLQKSFVKRIGQLEALGTRTAEALGDAAGRSQAAKNAISMYTKAVEGVQNGVFELTHAINGDKLWKTTERATQRYVKKVESLIENRKRVGGQMFDRAIAEAGDKASFMPNKTLAKIEELKVKYAGRMDPSEVGSLVSWLDNQAARFRRVEESRIIGGVDHVVDIPLDMQNLKHTISEFSEKAARPKDAIPNIDSFSTKKHVINEVYGALLDDLEAFASTGIPGAKQLKKARAYYRASSDQIRLFTENPLGAFVSKPEKLVDELFKEKNSPRQKAIMSMIHKLDPADAEAIGEAYTAELLKNLDNASPGKIARRIASRAHQSSLVFAHNPAALRRLKEIEFSGFRVARDFKEAKPYLEEPAKLITDLVSGKRPSTTAKVLRYVKATDPKLAENLSGAAFEQLFKETLAPISAGPGRALDTSKIAGVIENNMAAFKRLSGGNNQVTRNLADFADSARRISAASKGESSTYGFQLLEKLIQLTPNAIAKTAAGLTAGATLASVIGTAPISSSLAAAGGAGIMHLLSKSMVEPSILKGAREIIEIASQPTLSLSAKQRLAHAIYTTVGYKLRRAGMGDRDEQLRAVR